MSFRPSSAVVSTGAIEPHHHGELYVTRKEFEEFKNTLASRIAGANSKFEEFEQRHVAYVNRAYDAIRNLHESNVALMTMLEAWTNQQYEFNFELTKQVCALRAKLNVEACPPEWVYPPAMLIDQEMAEASQGEALHQPGRSPPRSATPYVLTTEEHQLQMARYEAAKQSAKKSTESSKKTVTFLLEGTEKPR